MKTNTSLSAVSKVPSQHLRPPRSRASLCLAASVGILLAQHPGSARADTFIPTSAPTATPASWNLPANWDTAAVPNAIGASVTFGALTGARTITVDSGAAGFTVGSISFDNSANFDNTLNTGTAGSKLILNNAGAGVTITTFGSGTGRNSLNVPITLSDLVTAQVDQTTASNPTGSLNWLSTTTGTGGFIKQGDGLLTFGTGAKTYTGPTVLNGGRIRISNTARPSATSSFTINAGAQMEMITAGTYTFGTGPLNLNGAGANSGPYAVFPGAIRNTTGLVVTITNSVILQSDTLIHVQATAGTGGNPTPTGSLTFSGVVSGPAKLVLTAPGSNIDQGSLILTNTNTYTGGTLVNGGILNVNSDSALGAALAGIELNTVSLSGVPLHAVLRASGPVSTTARTLTLTNVGGTIDTNGNDVTFGVGSNITDAGLPSTLRKIGAGKLTIAGTQTYDTLTTLEGRTDLASALGTGTSTINANAPAPTTSNVINISVNQTLTALSIGDGAVVTLGAPLPPTPTFASGNEVAIVGSSESDNTSPVLEGGRGLVENLAQAVPEPGSATLLLGGLSLLLSLRRRVGV